MTPPRITDAERAALAVAQAAVEGRASAYGPADAIVFALGSAQMLRTPADAAKLEQLLRERAETNAAVAASDEERAQLRARLAELQPYEALTPQTCERGLHLPWFVDSELQHACPWCRIAELEAGAPPSTAYRAEHCDMPIGPRSTFTSREAAGALAEHNLRKIKPGITATWQQSIEDDDVLELVIQHRGHTSGTGHAVRRITIGTAYEPEVDG
jgi:hypothetical protein